jgi:hypothetical protein
MERLTKNFDTLKVLSCCNKHKRNKILKDADNELILSICECIVNTLNGNVKFPPKIFNKLKKNKYIIRKINKSRNNLKKTKKILIQQGGFLQYLLPAAVTLLTGIIERLSK